jgi:hypothetical protein
MIGKRGRGRQVERREERKERREASEVQERKSGKQNAGNETWIQLLAKSERVGLYL